MSYSICTRPLRFLRGGQWRVPPRHSIFRTLHDGLSKTGEESFPTRQATIHVLKPEDFVSIIEAVYTTADRVQRDQPLLN
jgi:hypothetical protein